MRFWKVLGIVSVLAALVVAACGGGEEAPTATRAPAATTAPTARATTGATTAPTARPTPTSAPAPTATPVPVPTGQFRLAVAGIPGYNLLPGFATNKFYLDLMFDAMAGRNAAGKEDPTRGVLTSWTVSADGKSITAKVHSGVGWHNGDKLTSKDIKYSLDYYSGPESQAISSGSTTSKQYYERTDTPDDATAVIIAKQHDVFLAQKLLSISGFGTGSGYVLPAAYQTSVGVKEANKKPVGTGPYKYRADIPNQQLDMEAVSTHFFYGVPRFRNVTMLIIPEGTTRTALLKSGSAEAIDINKNDVPGLKTDFDVVQSPANKTLRYIIVDQFKTEIPGYGKNPTADARVRQAMSIAIDREAIVKSFVGGLAEPAISPQDLYDPAFKSYPVPKQDVAKAKALLAEAGWPNGFHMEAYLFTPGPGREESQEVMEAIAVYWENIGIKVTRKPIEVIAFYTGVIAKHANPLPYAAGIANFFASGYTAGNPAGIKTGPFRIHEDAVVDSLVKQIAAAKTYDEYSKLAIQEVERELEQWLAGPLYAIGDFWAVKKGMGADKWNMGRSSYSINLPGLITGKGN